MNSILHPLARFLVALIFLISGAGKVFSFPQTAEMMDKAGFPAASFFLTGAIVFEVFGGLLLLFGYKTRFAASLLIAFLIPATLIFHAVAAATAIGGDPAQMQMQVTQVLKNMAIMGALIKFWADGAGAFALDNWQVQPAAETQTA